MVKNLRQNLVIKKKKFEIDVDSITDIDNSILKKVIANKIKKKKKTLKMVQHSLNELENIQKALKALGEDDDKGQIIIKKDMSSKLFGKKRKQQHSYKVGLLKSKKFDD